MTARVTLIGLAGDQLPPGARQALAAARLVVGTGPALHRHVSADPGANGVLEVPAAVSCLPVAALDALTSAVAAGEQAVVLVSGDPGYFGVLRELRAHGLPAECLPAMSPVQRVAALIRRPWDDLTVVSTHGDGLRRAVNVCRARPAVGVLTTTGAGPAELAEALTGWHRTLVVAEDVGGPTEELSIVDPAEAVARAWRAPTVVLCLAELDRIGAPGWFAGGEPTPPAGGWALATEAFTDPPGLCGSPESRALALAKLAPRPGTLVWDVVAGSGAVGIEAARLGAAVLAVENDAGMCVRLAANARRFGVDVRLVDGVLPQALLGLPEPDATYLATARGDVVRACAAAGASRIVIEVHELDSVGPARDALVDAGYAVDGRLLSAAPIHGLSSGGASVAEWTSTLLLWGSRR
ncbi:precorrin-6Y C5,15-methyltransferase (decarboxylating) subunit CbiT [Actinophytocola sp.]|uniref:bifunctional cobalt-precorrin-7 (C(5))-methyltransferase/cobalt-precorrin-6B (C(15))-methyltransferase n=1 Tax=Actinophytocola sp. TaxID=1872138 RepID=UPI00389A1D84